MAIEVRWGSATHVGCVRSSNQDAVLAGPTVFAVADGMGGHAAGDVAAALAVEELARLAGIVTVDDLLEALHRANSTILEQAYPGSGREGMGTTVTGLALASRDDDDLVLIFNVGDSRTYRFADPALTQITIDHSLVAEMIRDGELDESDAPSHPARNVVTRALGIEGPLEIDLWTDPPSIGTTYLMCSDGLVNEVPDGALQELLSGPTTPQEKADQLVAMALEAGAHDNVSVVIATVEHANGSGPNADVDTNPTVAPDEDTNPTHGGLGPSDGPPTESDKGDELDA